VSIQIVTAGRHGQRCWNRKVGGKVIGGPLYGVKLYEARARRDGMLVWRLVRVLEEAFSVEETAMRAALKYADDHRLPFLPGVKNGERMTKVIS